MLTPGRVVMRPHISVPDKNYRVLGVLALGFFVVAGCSKGQAARPRGREESSKPMKTATVQQDSVRRAIEVVGTLAAEDQVTVSSQTEGAVSRIAADLGDRVHAGDALVELDKEKLQYNLDQQKAALTRTLAKYGATDPDNRPAIERTPDVQKASAELDQAKQAFDRAEELNKRQLVPKQALEDADTTLRSKLADRQLRDAVIRAPFDGYVQKRLVSLGEFVKSQTPVMNVVRVDPLKVIGEIPERMAPWIEAGQAVELRVDAFP